MSSAQLSDFLISFMPFERESFVPICTSLTFVCTSKGSEILYRGCAKTEIAVSPNPLRY